MALTDILSNLAAVVIIAAISLLVYFIRQGLEAWQANLEAAGKTDHWLLIDSIVDRVVLFVEQTMKSESSQVKKDLAVETAADWLRQYGIELNEEDIADRIEAAVYERLNDIRAV